MLGGAGNDFLKGLSDDDYLSGGEGNDVVLIAAPSETDDAIAVAGAWRDASTAPRSAADADGPDRAAPAPAPVPAPTAAGLHSAPTRGQS